MRVRIKLFIFHSENHDPFQYSGYNNDDKSSWSFGDADDAAFLPGRSNFPMISRFYLFSRNESCQLLYPPWPWLPNAW